MISRVLLWSFLALLLPLAAPLHADSIHKVDGSVIDSVVVDSETTKKVTYQYRLSGSGKSITQSVNSEEVEEVRFSRPEINMKRGMIAYRRGNYNEAVSQLRRVRTNKYKAYGYYYTGMSYRKMGQLQKAIAPLNKVAKTNHRLAPEAQFALGEVYLLNNSNSEAESTFKKLKSDGHSRFWTLKADFGLAKALLKQKKYSRAASSFKRVASSAPKKFSKLKNQAQEGEAMSYLGSGNTSRAKKIFEKILEKSNNSEVLAGAYLGLGKVFYGERKYKQAALAFLRVCILYRVYQRKSSEAARLAANCFKKMGKPDRAAKIKARFGG